MNTNLSHQEKQWIWKHVCWLGNINQIQKWEKLDVRVHWNWYSLSKWNYGLVKACECGNIDLVNLMIEKGADDWDMGLIGACRGGNSELANYMIEKGAGYWNGGLEGACYGGNRELVDLMIEKGAGYWNGGLIGACEGGKRELAELMIEKGATNDYLFDKYFP